MASDKEREREAKDWEAALATAKATWPSFHLTLDDFRAHVGAQGDVPGPPPQNLAADLYLACGCARRLPAALHAFDVKYRDDVEATARRLGRRDAGIEDARQAVYERLFTSPSSARTPKITEYTAKGSLRSWLRVVAARAIMNLAVRADDEEPVDDVDAFGMLAATDPELALMKERFADELRAALKAAAASLEPRDRAVLRLSFGSGVAIDGIAAMYGVHRATAARWIAKAHEDLSKRAQRELRTRLKVDESEYVRILELIASRFDTSLSRYLG